MSLYVGKDSNMHFFYGLLEVCFFGPDVKHLSEVLQLQVGMLLVYPT